MDIFLLDEIKQRKTQIEHEKKYINDYKVKIQNKVAAFLKDDRVATMQFPPIDKIFRTVIHEVCEEAGSSLICMGFGNDERYVIVYKNPPSELEIEARKSGDCLKWNKEIELEYKKKKAKLHEESIALSKPSECHSPGVTQQKASKKTKLVHLECEAINSDPNRSYGMVSSNSKNDKRTIEQALNDIQEKKRLKTQQKTD